MPRVEGGGEVGGGVSGGREAVPVGVDSRGFDDPFLSFFFIHANLASLRRWLSHWLLPLT